MWSRNLNTDFTLGDCFFGPVKPTNKANHGKYGCNSYGIGLDARS